MAMIDFVYTRRVTALVDERVECKIDEDRVKEVMDDSGYALTKEEAISYLMSNGEYERGDCEFEVDEIVMEHDNNIEIA